MVRVLDQLLALYGRPQALRLDNPPADSPGLCRLVRPTRIVRYDIQPGKPVQNAFIERFNRTYREEILDAYLFVSTQDVQ